MTTVRARSTAALSAIGPSNCRITGAATPTVCPSANWKPPSMTTVGATVVMVPLTGTVLPSWPTTEPLQV
nr:hypothetical protein CPGR_02397 [Mycolicibacter nonchromogenicus]